MPDSILIKDLEKAVANLEDYSLDSHWCKNQNYQDIQKVLDNGDQVTVSIIERLLAVCDHDMKEDMKYTTKTLSLISSIQKRVKAGDYPDLNLVPSALAVINMIKTTALLIKTDNLKTLCFETLLSYPDETLTTIAIAHTVEVIEIFSLYGHQRIPLENRIQTCNIIYKLLNILSPEKRGAFVKAGMTVWFSKVIPTVMIHLSFPNQDNLVPLIVLEQLTEELVFIDYFDNVQWQMLLDSICNPKRYPLIMKNLLDKGSNIWHRIWITFIKLLKSQITRSNNTNGSPINSMLLIVETAFKMDVSNRCRAFQCWIALTDNFCTETNESYINKRLKLLAVPLLSNNAKVEETALAKFNCWWNLILKFEHKLDKFFSVILLPFLRFCYGKAVDGDKRAIVPGKFSNTLKQQCRQALVEIFGHTNCNGCTNIPKLQGKILNTQYLVEHLAEWLHAFKSAVMLAKNQENANTELQIVCLWNSLLTTISNMADNTVRKDVTNETLSAVSCVILNDESNEDIAKIVYRLLIHSFDDDNVKQIFRIKDQDSSPTYNLIKILMLPSMHFYYKRHFMKELIQNFKPLTSFIVDEAVRSRIHITEILLKDWSPTKYSLALWTSLAQSMCDSDKDICVYNICDTLLWPLQHMDKFSKENISAEIWYMLYNFMYTKLNTTSVEEKIKQVLLDGKEVDSVRVWKLYVALAILKQTITKAEVNSIEDVVKLLPSLISDADVFDNDKVLISILADIIVALMESSVTSVNEVFAQTAASCFRMVLNCLAQKVTKDSDDYHLVMIRNILKSVETSYKVASSKIKLDISATLVEVSILYKKETNITNAVLPLMKSCLLCTDDNQIIQNLNNAIKSIEGNNQQKQLDNDMQSNAPLDKKAFSTPNNEAVPKKVKKKEASIVNTVVENGEEFVVVKSNWKFNPRKLTENQKEKLQRKREDIPALYQDLSQSQDEFKLSAWKTDSQDASFTNSKSASSKSNEESCQVLKNMPNTDVVPKIMENLLTDNSKNIVPEKDIAKDITLQKLISPRNSKPKSPRMALKDRVFRNVRNLIEKSSSPHEDKNISMNSIQNENVPKTPISHLKTICFETNSAPPLISSQRPSRLKRKPRKFEDTELFALKRGRSSTLQSESQLETDALDRPSNEDTIANDLIKQNDNQALLPTAILNDVKDVIIVPMEIGDIVPEDKMIESTVEIVTTEVIPHKDDNDKECCEEKSVEIINLESDTNCVNSSGKSNEHFENIELKTAENSECIHSSDDKSENENVQNKPSSITESTNTMVTSTELTTTTDSNLNVTSADNSSETVNCPKEVQESTPCKPKQISESKSTSKKKSRIETQLAIDMVEGHPFLQIQSEKRLTRKHVNSLENKSRRKSLHDKLNKTKLTFSKSLSKEKKTKDKGKINKADSGEIEENFSIPSPDSLSEEQACSEDVIESSQDSTLTSISVKSTKKIKRIPLITLEKVVIPNRNNSDTETVKQLDNDLSEVNLLPDVSASHDSKEDTELPCNYTAEEEISVLESTETMDTQPMDDKISDDVILINDDCEAPIMINTEDTIGAETQEIAEAVTQPNDPTMFQESNVLDSLITITEETGVKETDNCIVPQDNTANDLTESIAGTIETDNISVEIGKTSGTSSPCKDDAQRKKDFLNNTFEISPIKTMSPDREKKSPSPETSGEYVVIKLSSPVQSNGEPFETRGSPEIFTEEKVSPDKRDLSPPRAEVSVTNTSPSSSLSLKKNRPQVRSGGRGAQMLGLCVPERLPSKKADRVELEESNKNPIKTNTSNTMPVRRNLRTLYNNVNDASESPEETEEVENFLKLKRMLPTVDSSPSGPILKRKLADIVDDATMSPASKRKRVSFHDPPVSTTVSVYKYIEPCGVRSPQNSVQKRLERQMRAQTNLKSQKRLDTVFKLDSVLTKAIESFAGIDMVVSNNDDTQVSSLEQTPAVEVVKTSELNDTDPICSQLINCRDPIDNIAAGLSSAAMKSSLIKELGGKVETVGDLAKMTELEVNRLCIKAPKVLVAKKVLSEYAEKVTSNIIEPNIDMSTATEPVTPDSSTANEITVLDTSVVNAEMQTDILLTHDTAIQTSEVECSLMETQTDCVPSLEISVQTKESSFQSTVDIISLCLAERPDFVDKLCSQLETKSIQQISERLSVGMLTDIVTNKMTASDSSEVLSRVLQGASNSTQIDQKGPKTLSFLCDFLSDKFDSKDLILFCSMLLQRVHDK